MPQIEQEQWVVPELRDATVARRVPQQQDARPMAACLREQQSGRQGAVPPRLQVELLLPAVQQPQQQVSPLQEL